MGCVESDLSWEEMDLDLSTDLSSSAAASNVTGGAVATGKLTRAEGLDLDASQMKWIQSRSESITSPYCCVVIESIKVQVPISG